MSDDAIDPCEVVPNCPVCFSKLTVAHDHAKLKICVCKECGTSLSIPDDAFKRARMILGKTGSGSV